MDLISLLPLADKLKSPNVLGAGLRQLADLPDSPVGKKLAGAAAVGFSHALDHLAQPDAIEPDAAVKRTPGFAPVGPRAALHVAGLALEQAAHLHDIFANAPPALPGQPAAHAPENLPGFEQIRAAYGLISRLH